MPDPTLKPIYVLCGDDEYLRDSHRRRIVADVLADADPQLAVSTFDADTPLPDVLDALRSPPLLASRRVVILRDADAFVAGRRAAPASGKPEEKEEEAEEASTTGRQAALVEYLDRPSPTGVLVLIVRKWDSRTKLAKAVASVGEVIDCTAKGAGNLPRWLTQAAKRRGKELAPAAAGALLEYVGEDLAALDSEVEKLSLYVGPRAKINEEDVNVLTASTAGPDRFALDNALTAGAAPAVLKILDKTLTRRGTEFLVIGQIGSYLRRVIKAQAVRSSGGDPASILPPNIPAAARKAFLDLLVRRPMPKLRSDFRRLLAADLALKSGAEAKATLQELLLALCL